MEDTIDNALAPIEASIEKAKIYSPDNLTNTDVAQKKLDKDGNIIVEVDHGNGVATIGTEAKRVAKSYAQDVLYEFSELYLDVAEGFGYDPNDTPGVDIGLNQNRVGPLEMLAIGADKYKYYYENKMHHLHPQTEGGKAVRDIATELTILFATALGPLKKIKAMQGVPQYGQKAKKYFKNLASSALRWGTAEAIAAGIARDNESEPFTLMLTDLAGLTDSSDFEEIRLMYQEALRNGDDFEDFRIRAVKAADGFLTGVVFETVMSILGTTYKAHQAALGVGPQTPAAVGVAAGAEASITADQLQDQHNDKLIKQLFSEDLTIGPYND